MMKSTHSASRRPKGARTAPAQSTSMALLRGTVKVFSLSLAIGMALLLAFSLAAYLSPDPNALVGVLGPIACGLTALLGGIVSARMRHAAPLPAALINAALLSALMLPLSIPFAPLASGYSALVCALMHAAVFLLSALGAAIGVPRAKPKRRF